jgi:GT2 family glycosyltransferase
VTVSVVTPWWNLPDLHDDYLVAIETGQPDEVIVVDNASEPPLPFSTIRVDENLGYGKGSNVGLRAATMDAVLFLNNDVAVLSDDWLDRIRGAVEPGVLAGPLRYDRHGEAAGLQLPYIDGWCLAGMRDDLLELGGFNEEYDEPAYYSDNELCLRARLAGMTLRDVRPGLYHKRDAHLSDVGPAGRAATEANRTRFREFAARELVVA